MTAPEPPAEAPQAMSSRSIGAHPAPLQRTREWAVAISAVALATLVCLLARDAFALADQAMIHLLAVLLVSSRCSRGPSLLAAVLSVVAVDFFFVPPFFTLAVAEPRYVATFGVMLAVGLLVSGLTLRIREGAEAAEERERRTAALYAMSKELSAETDVERIAAIAVRHVSSLLGVEAAVLLDDRRGGLAPAPGVVVPWISAELELRAARAALRERRPAGSGTNVVADASALYVPIRATNDVGVLAVAVRTRSEPLSSAQLQLLETFAAQTGLALGRALLAREAEHAALAVETERLRSSLLASVSHDLRTPLASISGSAEVLLDPDADLDPAERRDLLRALHGEAERLGHLVTNLLDLTRLESGTLCVEKSWYPIEELIASALGRIQPALGDRPVRLDVPDELLLVPVDPVLLEQAIYNLLENAVKHTPLHATIELRARPVERPTERAVELEVLDRGPGLRPGDEARVFEKFHRGEGRGSGTGLGLAICQAIVRAHGGTIRAENREGGGARFAFTIPLEEPPPTLTEAPKSKEERT